MIKSPNGMVFADADEWYQYNKKMIEAERREIIKKLNAKKTKCKKCGNECIKLYKKEIYICPSCNMCWVGVDDEGEN